MCCQYKKNGKNTSIQGLLHWCGSCDDIFMMVYLELVPNANQDWVLNARETVLAYSFLSGINVPDIMRLPVRSAAAASWLALESVSAIPHIRAMDRDIPSALAMVDQLWASGVSSILVVSGDAPQNPSAVCFPVNSESLIAAIKSHKPAMTVYAALDPYRQSIRDELAYCRRKLAAGADGFFTQPFFDLKFAEIFLEQLEDTTVFLGIAPVTTENSIRYWVTTNNVVFPKSFLLGLEDNARLTNQMMTLAKRYHQHVYLMPIKVPVRDYLDAVVAVAG
jgi:methylenetetrahydrofolate reductase (NADPH)